MISKPRLLQIASVLLLVGFFLFCVLFLTLNMQFCNAHGQAVHPLTVSLTPQRARACGLRNGFDRDFTDDERVALLDWGGRCFWTDTSNVCGKYAEIDPSDDWPPPAIIIAMYGEPELLVWEYVTPIAIYGRPETAIREPGLRPVRACWCVKREFLATLSAGHPLRQALPRGEMPVRKLN